MAKRVNSVSLKGTLDGGLITEETKDSLDVYDLMAIIDGFDGKEISITIKEENPVPTVNRTA